MLSVCGCRYYGTFKADLLQQFVADELLQLPPIQAVSPHTLDRFLGKVQEHKVTVLAFSASAKASIPLRHAAQQHSHLVTAGRVQWKDEVSISNTQHQRPTFLRPLNSA